MNNEVEVYSQSSLPDRWQYAQAMSSAGDIVPRGLRTNNQPDAAKLFWVAETGSMLGIHPVAAIQGVNIIEGQPTLSPGLMSAVIRRAGHLIRVSVTGQIADLSIAAHAELVRRDDPDHPFRVTWTIEKAQRAGLLQVIDGKISAKVGRNNAPGAWEKYTEALLKARAIGEVCREGGTDALMGVVYMPEELGADVNEQGELVQLTESTNGKRPAPSAEDYRPIALADTPVDQVIQIARNVVAGNEPGTVVERQDEPETDQGIVEIYKLAEVETVIQAQQAWIAAQRNGHLDRPVQGKPLQQWLTDLVEEIKLADPDTGEVYEAG